MRHTPLSTLTFLGLALSLALAACDSNGDDAETMAEDTTGDSGDGDGDSGDGDGDSGDGDCYEQPAICEQFVRCVAAVAPDSAATVEEQYGPDGSCWCQGDAKANECYNTCLAQVEDALMGFPTESQCHEKVCGIDELDPDQPYGPIVNGSCTPYISEQGQPIEQMPFQNPLGVPGGVCAPQCSGLANYCPEHSQTSADGTCYISSGDKSYCVSRCYVDSTVVGGTQCQCGATCQPHGPPDGDNNMRGICTFE